MAHVFELAASGRSKCRGCGRALHKAELERRARASLAQHRLPRIDGAERAPSGQARCRQCHTPIERGSWRIRLALHDEGVFSPGGFIHAGCRQAYFDTADILEQVLHFSPGLVDADRDALREYFRSSGEGPS